MASSMGDFSQIQAQVQEAAEALVLRGDSKLCRENAGNFIFQNLLKIAVRKVREELEEKIRRNAQQFQLFPKFPAELQLAIWKAAMTSTEGSPGDRILRVKVDAIRGVKGKKELNLKFALSKQKKQHGLLVTSQQALDLRISRACYVARGVYLKIFKNTLPTGKKGLCIRYDDNTTIYIENLNIVANHHLFQKAVLQIADKQIVPSLAFPAYLRNITKLVLPRACFDAESRFNKDGCGIAGLIPLFTGLQLVAVNFHHYYDEELNDLQIDDACDTKAALERYAEEVDPMYKIPTVGAIEGERVDRRAPYQAFIRASDI